MWIRVSLSSLLPPIHVLWGAAFRWRVSNSGSFSTFETSLSQLPSCYWVTTLDSCILSLHLAFPPPSTRSPYLRNLLPESVGSVAGRSPEFNPCFEVIRVSIGGKETKQQLLDFRIFLLLLKSLELLRQCNDNALKRPRSGRQWWSSPNLHPNLQLAVISFVGGSREIQPATSASLLPPLK